MSKLRRRVILGRRDLSEDLRGVPDIPDYEFGQKPTGYVPPNEEHRNPAVRDLVASLGDELKAAHTEAFEKLLSLAGLPGLRELEAGDEHRKTVRKWSTKGVTLPKKKDFDLVFAEWADQVAGSAESTYPKHVVAVANEGAKLTHAELMATVSSSTVVQAFESIGPSQPYLKGFIEQGQELITHKITREFRNQSERILREGIRKGKGVYEIAYELFDVNGPKAADWHWDRLARSELAMSNDYGNYIDAKTDGAKYEKWLSSSTACEICSPFDGRVWRLGEGPRPVSSTHPNCQCDKQYLWDYRGKVQREPAWQRRTDEVPYPGLGVSPYREVKPETFRRKLVQGKRGLRKDLRPMVTTYSSKQYKQMKARCFVSPEGKSGFAVKPDGDIVSIWSMKDAGQGRGALLKAKRVGGTKLDCFDGKGKKTLPKFYKSLGFQETGRVPWDDQFAPKGWDYGKHGRPDVVSFELPTEV